MVVGPHRRLGVLDDQEEPPERSGGRALAQDGGPGKSHHALKELCRHKIPPTHGDVRKRRGQVDSDRFDPIRHPLGPCPSRQPAEGRRRDVDGSYQPTPLGQPHSVTPFPTTEIEGSSGGEGADDLDKALVGLA
jgi:hypothetical protein